MGMDLTAFDFDVESTELKAEQTKIEFEGADIDVLKVKVLLNEVRLTDLIKKLIAQQNFSSDTLSGQSIESAASVYESIDVESASYVLYIDKDNNVKRYEVATVYSMDMQGQKVTYDMQIEYNIVNTGDSIEVTLPKVDPQEVIPFNQLYNYNL